MKPEVGVLALQGDVAEHRAAFAELGVAAREVRSKADLERLTHLVIPGGESTTLHHLLELFELKAEIVHRHRARRLALFGTCAGAILLGGDDAGEPPPRLGLLDAVLERNAYGRQVDSSARSIRFDLFDAELRCVFIRAPRFRRVGVAARVLAGDGDDPILVAGPGLLAATFHPELGDSRDIHQYFLRPELWAPSAPSRAQGGEREWPRDGASDEQNPQVVRA